MKLGDLVKERISGLEGIVTAYAEYAHNCNRLQVTPQGLIDGKPADSHWFDDVGFTVVEAGKIEAVPLVTHEFKLLDEVKDNFSPFQGKIIGFITFLNGCVRAEISSPTLEKGIPVDNTWFAVQSISLVKKVEKPVPPVKTGGPMKNFQHRNPK